MVPFWLKHSCAERKKQLTDQKFFFVRVFPSSVFCCPMVVKRSPSKGTPCKTLAGRPCTLNTKYKGEPCYLGRDCPDCGERRCKKHCWCGRNKKAKGRKAPRTGQAEVPKTTAAAQPKTAPKPAQQQNQQPDLGAEVVLPVGAPCAPHAEKLKKEVWWRNLLADARVASELELVSYMYDEPQLQSVLLERLQGRNPFKLRLYLDEDTFGGTTPYFQRSRVRALYLAGLRSQSGNSCQVFLCRGETKDGSYHHKGLVADRRYFYSGNGNFTNWSRTRNGEWLFYFRGPLVNETLEELAEHRQRGRLWDGN